MHTRLFLVLVVVGAVLSIGVSSVALQDDCPAREWADIAIPMIEDFQDTHSVASVTPVNQLAPLVLEMHRIRRAVSRIELPDCLQGVGVNYDDAMFLLIRGYEINMNAWMTANDLLEVSEQAVDQSDAEFREALDELVQILNP